MVVGFALLITAGLLLEAGISGRSLADVVRGIATANHRLKLKLPAEQPTGVAAGEGDPPTGDDFVDSILGSTGGTRGKSPKGVIDSVVIPIARKHGWSGNAASITAANALHSVNTSSGNRSEHKGPPSKAWAGDFGTARFKNGDAGVDAFMREVAQTFGFPTHKGLQNKMVGKMRIQLIWQAPEHYDHGHVGVSVR